ncbi:MAG: hypothetical protein KDC98_23470, partial [Planctomycetes bacterium]|nr:hypothetical protein [Planctomycetota bacterium]
YNDAAADYDFYRLLITRPGQLRMETLPTAPFPAMRDTVLFLTNSSYAPIATDDDSGFGLFSLLSTYVIPGTYYVAIKGENAGNYVLDITLTPMPAPGQATVTVRSGGCGPTLGLRQTVAGPTVTTEVPVLGSTYYLDGGNMPANALLIRVIGTDPLPTPFDLGPIGAPGCLLFVDPIDQSPTVADASGHYYWPLRSSPLDIAFIGLTLEQQIAVVDPLANPLGITISNRVSSVCGAHN